MNLCRDQWFAGGPDEVSAGLDDKQRGELKRTFKWNVSMLWRLIARVDAVSESSAEYNAADAYEYRDVEYEHETEGEPEPSR